MFEILAVLVFVLVVFSVFVLLPILFVIRAAQWLFKPAVDEFVSAAQEEWRHADAFERERMVRKAVGWRVIGRVASAGALSVGAVTFAPLPLVPICLMAEYRLLKPITLQMRDACAYRSRGRDDEPRYSSVDFDAL